MRNGTQSERWRAADASTDHPPRTLAGINRLPAEEKRAIYTRLIPDALFDMFHLDRSLVDAQGRNLLYLNSPAGSSSTEMALYHQSGFPDPVLYGEIADTFTGYVHVMLYVLNDPASPRFDIDTLPDGTPTGLGAVHRNLPAELAAMQFGLAPGQIRAGLRMLPLAIAGFERFVTELGHDMYFAEPLYYHNAILFERYGFAYQKGRRLIERIEAGFAPGGDLTQALDGSTPFRSPAAAASVRLRSWALHDGLLGQPFTGVTMYKHIGQSNRLDTCSGCPW